MIKYCIENGKPKLFMTEMTAKEVKIAIHAFKAGQKAVNGKVYRPALAKYVVDRFLNEESSKEAIASFSKWENLNEFLVTIENEINKIKK